MIGRAPVEAALRRLWRGDSGAGPALLAVATAPLSVLFRLGVSARNALYDREVLPAEAPVLPVLSVGNLAVGGTGKTPVTAWVARTLRDHGRRPAIVLRGYGSDEVELHRRWNPDIPVLVTPRRADGVREARELGSDVAILDDAFQHRRLRRDLDFVLLSPAHPLPPRLLPRGPYREPLAVLRRAHRVVVTAKGADELPAARALAHALESVRGLPPVSLFPLVEGPWTGLDGAPCAPPGGPPLAVTSVAMPEAFASSVERLCGSARGLRAFPDHHPYTMEDARELASRAGSGWIATTEKDAVKLMAFEELLPPVRVLPLVPGPEGVRALAPVLASWADALP